MKVDHTLKIKRASHLHCSKKPAPKPEEANWFQMNLYMPNLSDAMSLESNGKVSLEKYRLKTNKIFWPVRLFDVFVKHMDFRLHLYQDNAMIFPSLIVGKIIVDKYIQFIHILHFNM